MKIIFDILEFKDGVKCQVIFAGEKDDEIQLSGVVEGSKKIFTNPKSGILESIDIFVLITTLITGIFLLILYRKGFLKNRYLLTITSENNENEKSTFNFTYGKLILLSTMTFTIIMLLALLLSTILLNPIILKKENGTDYLNQIPKELRSFE